MSLSVVLAAGPRSRLGGARPRICSANARAASRVPGGPELELFEDPARPRPKINSPEELAAAGG